MKALNSLDNIVAFLNELLHPERFVSADRCLNGLQVDARGEGILAGDKSVSFAAEASLPVLSTVAVAVDPGCSVIERAIEGGAQLLLLHHGLLYGDLQPLVGPLGRRVRRCFESGLSVYASHLPLDSHLEVGNAGVIARRLGLTEVRPFLEYRGVTIGVSGSLSEDRGRADLVRSVQDLCGGDSFLALNFGGERIKKVGVATGAAAIGIAEAHRLGFDMYITGETSQAAYHDAKDLGMNVIFAGHYNTETFGVKRLGELLAEKFGLKTLFIDEPTGI